MTYNNQNQVPQQKPKVKITLARVLIALIPLVLFHFATGMDMYLTRSYLGVPYTYFGSLVISFFSLFFGAGLGPLTFFVFLMVRGMGRVTDIISYLAVIVGVFLGNILGYLGMMFIAIEGNDEFGYRLTSYLGLIYIVIATVIFIINMIGYANKE